MSNQKRQICLSRTVKLQTLANALATPPPPTPLPTPMPLFVKIDSLIWLICELNFP